MQYQELEGKSEKEISGMLTENRSKLHGLTMKRSVNQIKDVRESRETRKQIARLMTKLTALKAQA